ncbi:hypothetical protein EDB81DRAFT_660635 [Dactylonectria macrodidyma]|uniref:Rhodopsin domain-containing protein n=1 Tax=Dactylonectria macrodidyma TaxID=307937 RepID=A0A9P9ITU2_9HYPO|nr:hypothetical protein EDB81DRAFT_660635 [Dactylonectria macrodidyma]
MNQQPPRPDGNTNVGSQALGIMLGIFLGCLILYASRIYTHLTPTNRLGAPDYVISLAVILEIPILVLIGVSVSEGLGRYSYDISPENKGLILYKLFVTGQIGIWVAFLARTSIAVMLIQLDVSLLWRFLLYIAIFIQVATPFSLNVAMFAQCRPLSAMWEPVSGAKCWTKKQRDICYYFMISELPVDLLPNTRLVVAKCKLGAAAASDITFAVMPGFIIWSLKRPLLERGVITVLMALGLSATGVVIARAIVTANISANDDRMRKVVLLSILCRLEDGLLIAAACVPFLKRPIGRCLHRKFGLPRFQNEDIELNSFHSVVDQPRETRSIRTWLQIG